MDEPIFKTAPFFLLRVPQWPIEVYEEILSSENMVETVLNYFETNEQLREAILIASPSLYQSLKQKPFKDPFKIASSLLNYISRISTRTTPFGLFSFVTSGIWAQRTKISFNLSKVCKRTRPDMEWLYVFIKKLYQSDNDFSMLLVKVNPLIQLIDERYSLTYIHTVKKNEIPKIVTIRASKLIMAIFRLTKNPRKIASLLEELKKSIPILEIVKIQHVIKELISQQFLVPGILPSLLNISPIHDFLASVPSPEIINDVVKNIQHYDKLPLGKGESFLRQLQVDMEAIVPAKTFLQIDSMYEKRTVPKISKIVSKELEEAVNLLWKISACEPCSSLLNAYHIKFLEKYGVSRTIPLLELLSYDKGLGSFEDQKSLEVKSNPNFSQQWKNWLSNAWQDCLCNNNNEIIITDTLINKLFDLAKEKPPNPEKASLSLDIFCKIFANSELDIKQGKFLLLLSQVINQGGSTMGRFLDILGNDIKTKLRDFFKKEEELEQNALFIEVSYWPTSVRSANVAVQPCLRNYKLDIIGGKKLKNSFSLEDIYVGVTLDKFYLTLKDGKKEVISCFGNLLNPTYAPLPLRFMREVALQRNKGVETFSWGEIRNIGVFLPRVRYQKTILSPAQWQFDSKLFVKEKSDEIISKFTSFAERWNLPFQFFLARNDQYLLLDRRRSLCLREIVKKIKRGESLRFIENIKNLWVKSDKGSHFSEFVIPLLKNRIYSKKKKINYPIAYCPISFENRWKLPGSEWMFSKFYLGKEEMNRFLVEHLTPFAELLSKKMKLLGWFFVRYYDPEPHLRFRVKLCDSKALPEFLALLEKKSSHWMKNNLIKDISLASYEREVERYGGLAIIETVEAVFCADSFITINLLKAFLGKKIILDKVILHTLSTLNFLKNFNLRSEDIISLLSSSLNDKSQLEGFRKYKRQLNIMVKSFEKNNTLVISNEMGLFREIFGSHNQAMHLFVKLSKSLPIKKLSSIYNDMLHMHYNRLGCDIIDEKQARLYSYKTLYQLKFNA